VLVAEDITLVEENDGWVKTQIKTLDKGLNLQLTLSRNFSVERVRKSGYKTEYMEKV